MNIKPHIGLLAVLSVCLVILPLFGACTASEVSGNSTLEPSLCPADEQPAPLVGSEITGYKDPNGLILYPGSVQTDYNEPPEWFPGIYAWYVIPASPEKVFDFFINQAHLSGYEVVTGAGQVKMLQNKGTITIDIYPETDQPGYDTQISVFWYGEG